MRGFLCFQVRTGNWDWSSSLMYLVPLLAAFQPKRSSKPSSAERAALAVFYISISREGHTPLWSTSLTIRRLGCSLPSVKVM